MSLLAEVMKSLLRRPSTIEYPRVQASVESDYRGVHYASLKRCVGCALCMINCPSQCISMVTLPPGVQLPQNRRGVFPVVRYSSCVFCHRCVRVCPVGAFVVTSEYRVFSLGGGEASSRELSISTLRESGGGS
ncbi:MAG: 4Fe-4S binding protein [Acidilobaceae archaeon]